MNGEREEPEFTVNTIIGFYKGWIKKAALYYKSGIKNWEWFSREIDIILKKMVDELWDFWEPEQDDP